MQFTDDDIRKYQALCRKYFNEEVDEKIAIEEMHSLVYLVSLIYHPRARRDLEHAQEASRTAHDPITTGRGPKKGP